MLMCADRQWRTMTIKADQTLLTNLFNIFLIEVQALRNVSGVIPSTNLHSLAIWLPWELRRMEGMCLASWKRIQI